MSLLKTSSVYHGPTRFQLRLRWLWINGTVGPVWLNVGGHKPLAHLPRWKRHLLHLPSIRWRLL